MAEIKINSFIKGGEKMLYLERPNGFVPDLEAVGCFVVRKEKILVLKRRPDDPLYPGLWGLPSGKVDPGETPGEAMFRELQEETGIRTNLIENLGKGYVAYPDIKFVYYMFRYDIEDWMFLKRPECPKIILNPEEHVESRFMTLGKVITMDNVMLDTDLCIRHFYKP